VGEKPEWLQPLALAVAAAKAGTYGGFFGTPEGMP